MPQAAPKGGPGGGHEAFLLAVAPEASSKEVVGACFFFWFDGDVCVCFFVVDPSTPVEEACWLYSANEMVV